MTVFTKTVFSLAMLAAGFGLASLLGPPELADRFADALRPAPPQPAWGALQPLDEGARDNPAWSGYESAAFRQPLPATPAPPQPQRAIASAEPPMAPYGGPAPLWSPEPGTPVASWAGRPLTPVDRPAAAPTRRDPSVATAAWRESTAPIGWPTRETQPAEPPTPPSQPTPTTRGLTPWAAGAPPATPAPAAEPWDASPPLGEYRPFGGAEAFDDTRSFGAAEPFQPIGSPAPAATPATNAGYATPEPPRVASRELTPIAPRLPAREPIRHIVADGDTLARLAERYLDSPQRAGEIFLANQPTLTHPDLLPIGAEIVIPDRDAGPPPGQRAEALAPRAQLLAPQAIGAAPRIGDW